MSMLLGPLSETMSSVSCRDCTLAEEKMAGVVTAPATAAVDFRKSRRFMGCPSSSNRQRSRDSSAKVVPVSEVRYETAKPLLPGLFIQKYRQRLRSRRTPAAKSTAYNIRERAQNLGEFDIAGTVVTRRRADRRAILPESDP